MTLYERGTKGFQLTTAGRRILGQCETIVAMVQELGVLALDEQTQEDTIRIGVSEVIMLTWMPDLIEALKIQFCEVHFDISVDTTQMLAERLRSDEFSIVLVTNSIEDTNVVNAPICSYKVGWLASPTIFDGRQPLNVVDLAKFPIIMPQSSTLFYASLKDYLKRHGIEPEGMKNCVRIDSGISPATGLELVRRGVGIMALPIVLAQEFIKSGEVNVIPVREPFPPLSFFASYKTPPTLALSARIVETAQAVTRAVWERNRSEDFWP